MEALKLAHFQKKSLKKNSAETQLKVPACNILSRNDLRKQSL